MDSTTDPFRLHVLVVDDEETILELLSEKLRRLRVPVRVERAGDSVQAREYLRENTPDVIILDLVMPRLNGAELCRQLRQDPRFRTTPVIAVTGSLDPDVLCSAETVGFTRIFTKPMRNAQFDEMREILQDAIGSKILPAEDED